jgi:Protein kinase domain
MLAAAVNISDAHLYSSHFPAGHGLHRDFVRRYAPGAQIGVGAFGFVVTARDRLTENEVAVKFIEKGKVPAWGWSHDPELGRVPTEAVLLKLLDHPGIIKSLDFFQDRVYFYLVCTIHVVSAIASYSYFAGSFLGGRTAWVTVARQATTPWHRTGS